MKNKIHFIAVGGSIMHNLALELKHLGHQVSGSDDLFFEPSKSRLKAAGLLPKKMGWDDSKVTKDLDFVILGMHAKKDNPELKKAQKLGLKIFSFPAFMYAQTKDKKRIIVAGSHGKTTITSFILHALKQQNIQTDYLVGAQLDRFERMVHIHPDSQWAVFEGDEYLTSCIDRRSKFLHYKPNITVLTGIAWDHMNVFQTFDAYLKPFIELIQSKTSEDLIIYNKCDQQVVNLISKYAECRTMGYDMPEQHNGYNQVIYNQQCFNFSFFGSHNLNNLQAAMLVCRQMGLKTSDFYKALSSFKGAGKRLEQIYHSNKFTLYRDFAHAPSKLKASIKALKEKYSSKPLIACYELHTFSSLQTNFLPHYKDSMIQADHKIIYVDQDVLRKKGSEVLSSDQIKDFFNDQTIQVSFDQNHFKSLIKQAFESNSVLALISSGSFSGLNYHEFANQLESVS